MACYPAWLAESALEELCRQQPGPLLGWISHRPLLAVPGGGGGGGGGSGASGPGGGGGGSSSSATALMRPSMREAAVTQALLRRQLAREAAAGAVGGGGHQAVLLLLVGSGADHNGATATWQLRCAGGWAGACAGVGFSSVVTSQSPGSTCTPPLPSACVPCPSPKATSSRRATTSRPYSCSPTTAPLRPLPLGLCRPATSPPSLSCAHRCFQARQVPSTHELQLSPVPLTTLNLGGHTGHGAYAELHASLGLTATSTTALSITATSTSTSTSASTPSELAPGLGLGSRPSSSSSAAAPLPAQLSSPPPPVAAGATSNNLMYGSPVAAAAAANSNNNNNNSNKPLLGLGSPPQPTASLTSATPLTPPAPHPLLPALIDPGTLAALAAGSRAQVGGSRVLGQAAGSCAACDARCAVCCARFGAARLQ